MNEEMTFEQAMQRLDEIVKAMESGDLPLANSMELYKEGSELSRFCHKKLEQAKMEIEMWRNGEAVPVATGGECPF